MKVRDFLLERYFARYEFSVRHLLSPSDCEALRAEELLEGSGPGVGIVQDEELRLTEYGNVI